jgi:hypothetical protein
MRSWLTLSGAAPLGLLDRALRIPNVALNAAYRRAQLLLDLRRVCSFHARDPRQQELCAYEANSAHAHPGLLSARAAIDLALGVMSVDVWNDLGSSA